MANLRELPCGTDLLQVDQSPGGVKALYEQVASRMSAPSPRPLAVVDDSSLSARQIQARLESAPAHSDVVLATSGSTASRPNLVGLSWDALRASAEETNRYLDPKKWLISLPPHHIAGFQIVVRSVLLGTQPLVATSTSHLRSELGALPSGTVVSLVPTQLLDLSSAPLDRFQAILVGGARFPDHLREVSALLPIVTSYGMTETAGGCVYDGTPLPGTVLRIDRGRVLISGPTLMDGYLDSPSPFVEIGGRKYLVTSDTGTWDGQTLSILGRADQVIISGGENLNPAAIEDAIATALPDLPVAVIGIPDDRWGEVVCAAIVASASDLEHTAVLVRESVRAKLGSKAAPRRVVPVPELPLLTTGKVDLRTLRGQVLEAVRSKKAWSAD